MDKATMEQLIDRELELIPRGDLAQQTFRMTYEVKRLHDLKAHDPLEAPRDVFRGAVRDVQRRYAAFLPAVTDPHYFDLRPGEYQMPE